MVEFDVLEQELMRDSEFAAGHKEVQAQVTQQQAGAERMASAGIFLRLEREEQHLDIEYVAKKSDIRPDELDAIERGAHVPTFSRIERIAAALGDRVVQQVRRWNEEFPFDVDSIRNSAGDRSSTADR